MWQAVTARGSGLAGHACAIVCLVTLPLSTGTAAECRAGGTQRCRSYSRTESLCAPCEAVFRVARRARVELLCRAVRLVFV